MIALAKAILNVPVDDEITVLADDPAAQHDIPAWCRMRGQALVSAADGRYVIRRLR